MLILFISLKMRVSHGLHDSGYRNWSLGEDDRGVTVICIQAYATQLDGPCELGSCFQHCCWALMAEIMGHQWHALATLFPRAPVYRCVGCILHKGTRLREWVGGEIKAMLSCYPEEGISFPNLSEFLQEMSIEHLQRAKSWENQKQVQKLK